MSTTRGLVLGSATAALLLALTACGPGADPGPSTSPDPAPTSTAEPTTEPTTEPAPAALSIPGCDAVLPIAEAKAVFSDATVLLEERSPASVESAFGVPLVQSTLAAADPVRACTWGVPNSGGGFTGAVASVTEAERTALEAALTAAGFSSAIMGTVTGFDQSMETELGEVAETHLFTGEAWIVVNAPSAGTSGAIAGLLLDTMRTANPAHGL